MRTVFLAFLIGGGIIALLIVICGALLADVPDDEPALPLSLGPNLDHAPDSMAGLAPGLGPRDPVLGTDLATADRHARLRAFQQRETTERSARSFLTRGF